MRAPERGRERAGHSSIGPHVHGVDPKSERDPLADCAVELACSADPLAEERLEGGRYGAAEVVSIGRPEIRSRRLWKRARGTVEVSGTGTPRTLRTTPDRLGWYPSCYPADDAPGTPWRQPDAMTGYRQVVIEGDSALGVAGRVERRWRYV
jgi:hypothetical protein